MDLVKVANYLTTQAVNLRKEADRFDAAANDLICLTPGIGEQKQEVTVTQIPDKTHKKRHLSAAARKRISLAQKARWARFNRMRGKSTA